MIFFSHKNDTYIDISITHSFQIDSTKRERGKVYLHVNNVMNEDLLWLAFLLFDVSCTEYGPVLALIKGERHCL